MTKTSECVRTFAIVALALCCGACARETKVERFDATPATETKSTTQPSAAAPKIDLTTRLAVMQAGTLEIHFIKVGQGDCTLIKCPNGKSVLVDCGSLKEMHPFSTRKYLRDHLPDLKLDALVITHPDSDHYNMMPYAITGLTFDRLILIGSTDEYDSPANVTSASQKTSHGFENWVEGISPQKLKFVDQDDINSEDSSSTLFDTGEVEIYVVAAEIDDPGNLSPVNTRSIVLVHYDEFDCLLTGDATFPTENSIMNRYDAEWLDVDVLKLGHHGSRITSTSKEWADAVKPEVCIASACHTKMHGHPSHDLRDKLEMHTDDAEPHAIRWWRNKKKSYSLSDYEEATYCTAQSGTIVVKTDGESYEVLYKD